MSEGEREAAEAHFASIFAEAGYDHGEMPRHYPTSCLIGRVFVEAIQTREEVERRVSQGDLPGYYRSHEPFVFVCTEFRHLAIPFQMSGDHKLYLLPRSINVNHALDGLLRRPPPRRILTLRQQTVEGARREGIERGDEVVERAATTAHAMGGVQEDFKGVGRLDVTDRRGDDDDEIAMAWAIAASMETASHARRDGASVDIVDAGLSAATDDDDDDDELQLALAISLSLHSSGGGNR